jgi:hypothetical protein
MMANSDINNIILRRLDRQEDIAEKRHNQIVSELNSLKVKVDTTNGRVLNLESREAVHEGRLDVIERTSYRVDQAHAANIEERAFLSMNRREWAQMFLKTLLPNGLSAAVIGAIFFLLTKTFG